MKEEIKKIIVILTFLGLTFYAGLMTGIYLDQKENCIISRLEKIEKYQTDLCGRIQAIETIITLKKVKRK